MFRPRLSGAETPSAGGALATGLGESRSGLDLAEAERVCGLWLAACRVRDFFWSERVVSNICGGYNKWTT
jgi:hypothetical protein